MSDINKLSKWLKKCGISSTEEKFYQENKYYNDDNDNEDIIDFYNNLATDDDNINETFQKNLTECNKKNKQMEIIINGDSTTNLDKSFAIHDEIVSLKDSIKTIESSINNRLNLLE
ncbi:hypothetical protein C1645_825585 [Glomus cerebriforme]|uniref:Uncharacterized protein n=1 Tax=Glomus cerebriforme TaxID=658196 RepID=A0A397ST64_9GLOM|nr:hypothetical protein C1645_825585 [Glomus cerebriforme]